jgi:hypothetical protein
MGTGAEWLLKLDADQSGAKTISSALDRVDAAAAKTGKSLDSVAAKEKAIGHGADEIGRSAGHAWHEVAKGEAAWAAVHWGAEKAVELIKEVKNAVVEAFSASVSSERSGKVFENILGSKEEKAEVFEYLEEFSKLSEFTDDDLKGISAGMLEVGMRGDLFKASLEAAADAASRFKGDKMVGLTNAAEALMQIQRTGMVNNRTTKGLMIDPHELEKQISKDLNIPVDVIKKRMQEGGIKGSEVMGSIFRTMMSKTGKDLGESAMAMSKLMGAKIAKVKDIPEEIGKTLKNSKGYAMIGESLDKVLESFSPDSDLGKQISSGLASVLEVVGKTIKEINFKTLADGLTGVLQALEGIVRLAGIAVDKLAKLSAFVFPTVKPTQQTSKNVKAIEEMAEPGGLAKAKTSWSMPSWLRFGLEDSGEGWAAVAQLNKKAEASGKEVAIGLGKGMLDGQDWVTDAARKNMEGADQTTREAGEIKSPSRLFFRHGEMMAEGLALGMEASAPRIAVATDSMVAVPSLGNMGAGIGSGGFNAGGISIPMTFHVGGSGASADDIAREVSALVPSALLSALEQLAIQCGTS